VPINADPVSAISEADAQGDIADIYDDIRQTLGVDAVNLVWLSPVKNRIASSLEG